MRYPYQIGDGWLVVMMTAEEADAWNDNTLRGEVLRSLLARRRDEEDYTTLGELLDSDRVSRDDLADPASLLEWVEVSR